MGALNRADDFVAGAEASFNVGALASCALCCYAAVFWAQIAVLERLGKSRGNGDTMNFGRALD